MNLNYKHFFTVFSSCVFLTSLWCAHKDCSSAYADLPISLGADSDYDASFFFKSTNPDDANALEELGGFELLDTFWSGSDTLDVPSPTHSQRSHRVQDEARQPIDFSEEEDSCSEEDSCAEDDTHSAIPRCSEPTNVQGPVPKKLSKAPRCSALMVCLKEGWVDFALLKNNVYYGCAKRVFKRDILQAMHSGADIIEKNKHYHCLKELTNRPSPSERVAVAMFHLLSQKRMTLFELRFQLYRKGYIDHSPESLLYLVKAFELGGVHPANVGHKMRDGVSVKSALQNRWEEIQNLDQYDVDRYLQKCSPSAPDKERVSKKNRQVLRRLWTLQKTNDLTTLRYLKSTMTTQPVQKALMMDNYEGKRKNAILDCLCAHKCEEISLDRLIEMVGWPQKGYSLLNVLLLLVIKGFPIIYDKSSKSVMFVNCIPPVEQLPEKTNLLTTLYDLTKKHGPNLSLSEIAYYVYRKGLWPCGFSLNICKGFYKTIHLYKAVLVMQDYIDIQHCYQSYRKSVSCAREVLKLIQSEGALKDLEYYKFHLFPLNPKQEDLDTAVSVKHFIEKEEFRVFLSYVSNPRTGNMTMLQQEKIVKSCVYNNQLTYKFLWNLCENFGMQQSQELWSAARNLTQSVHKGRLIYDPRTTIFVWDEKSRCVFLKEEEQVVEIYSLQRTYPYLSHEEFVHMLAQNGGSANTSGIQNVLNGLSLLGFRSENEKFYALSRKILQGMLTKTDDVMDIAEKNPAWDVAQDVYSWLGSGAMELLWKTYLTSCGQVLQEGVHDQEETQPRAKRQKLDVAQENNPVSIIDRDIPALKMFLLTKGL